MYEAAAEEAVEDARDDEYAKRVEKGQENLRNLLDDDSDSEEEDHHEEEEPHHDEPKKPFKLE